MEERTGALNYIVAVCPVKLSLDRLDARREWSSRAEN
jgi:hypothetical protein